MKKQKLNLYPTITELKYQIIATETQKGKVDELVKLQQLWEKRIETTLSAFNVYLKKCSEDHQEATVPDYSNLLIQFLVLSIPVRESFLCWRLFRDQIEEINTIIIEHINDVSTFIDQDPHSQWLKILFYAVFNRFNKTFLGNNYANN